jgi:hypothetical protein
MRARPLLAPLLAVAFAAATRLRWETPLSFGILTLATLILALALLAPQVYAPIQTVLTRLGRAVATAVAWLLLGLIFLTVFIPGRLLLALRHRDPLQRHPDPARTTYWEPIPPVTSPDRFERQY